VEGERRGAWRSLRPRRRTVDSDVSERGRFVRWYWGRENRHSAALCCDTVRLRQGSASENE